MSIVVWTMVPCHFVLHFHPVSVNGNVLRVFVTCIIFGLVLNVDCIAADHVPFGVLCVLKIWQTNIWYVEAVRVQIDILFEGGGHGSAKTVVLWHGKNCKSCDFIYCRVLCWSWCLSSWTTIKWQAATRWRRPRVGVDCAVEDISRSLFSLLCEHPSLLYVKLRTVMCALHLLPWSCRDALILVGRSLFNVFLCALSYVNLANTFCWPFLMK